MLQHSFCVLYFFYSVSFLFHYDSVCNLSVWLWGVQMCRLNWAVLFHKSWTNGDVVLNLSNRHHWKTNAGKTWNTQLLRLSMYISDNVYYHSVFPCWNVSEGDDFISKWLLTIYWLQSMEITLFRQIVNCNSVRNSLFIFFFFFIWIGELLFLLLRWHFSANPYKPVYYKS